LSADALRLQYSDGAWLVPDCEVSQRQRLCGANTSLTRGALADLLEQWNGLTILSKRDVGARQEALRHVIIWFERQRSPVANGLGTHVHWLPVPLPENRTKRGQVTAIPTAVPSRRVQSSDL